MSLKAAIVSLIQAGISSGLPGIGNSECSYDPWSNNDETFVRKKDQIWYMKTHFCYLKQHSYRKTLNLCGSENIVCAQLNSELIAICWKMAEILALFQFTPANN